MRSKTLKLTVLAQAEVKECKWNVLASLGFPLRQHHQILRSASFVTVFEKINEKWGDCCQYRIISFKKCSISGKDPFYSPVYFFVANKLYSVNIQSSPVITTLIYVKLCIATRHTYSRTASAWAKCLGGWVGCWKAKKSQITRYWSNTCRTD
jgi:hypothetical protein